MALRPLLSEASRWRGDLSEYQRRIVRNNRTGKLEEIDIHELPPLREAEPGRSYVFARGEEVPADHEAVLDGPGRFREAPEK